MYIFSFLFIYFNIFEIDPCNVLFVVMLEQSGGAGSDKIRGQHKHANVSVISVSYSKSMDLSTLAPRIMCSVFFNKRQLVAFPYVKCITGSFKASVKS